MRPPRDSDFFLPIDDVGTFRYGRRNLGDRLDIRIAFLDVAGVHGDLDEDVAFYAGMIATHKILCVEAPEGWDDLSLIDTTDPKRLDQVYALFHKLKEMEDSFAKGVTKSGEDGSPGVVPDDRVLVSQEVQPLPAGSEIS